LKAIRIILTIGLPDDCTVDVKAVQTDVGEETEKREWTPRPVPVLKQPTARQAALLALQRLGVEDPGRFTRKYAPGRIIAACQEAEERHRAGNVEDPAAWTVAALRRGWTLKCERTGKKEPKA